MSRRVRATALFGRGQALTDEQADQLLRPGRGAPRRPDAHLRRRGHARRGAASTSTASSKLADADELIVAHQAPTTEGRLRSVTLLAEAMETVGA